MRKNRQQYWFVIGLISVLIAAPNATIIRYTTSMIDPSVFIAIRFFIVSLLTLPYLLKHKRKINSANSKYILKSALFMAIAVFAYVWAIKLSQASYVAILTLLTPIVFVIDSMRMTNDKISKKAFIGLVLAIVGALLIVVLPIALKDNGSFVFYPAATILALINSLTFPLAIINYRKANENGVPMVSLMSITSIFIFCISFIFIIALGLDISNISMGSWLGILYSGLAVAFLARILNIASYEHIGSVITSILQYLETLIAIVLPIVLLNENISKELVIGGALILMGVVIAEYHKTPHHKHIHALKSH